MRVLTDLLRHEGDSWGRRPLGSGGGIMRSPQLRISFRLHPDHLDSQLLALGERSLPGGSKKRNMLDPIPSRSPRPSCH